MKEVWKDIPGFEDYQVSNTGKVCSVARTVKTWNGTRPVRERIKKTSVNRHGYEIVTIRTKTVSVHRLVAKAFLPNPEGLPEVNHSNGIKIDNWVSNLEWSTHSANMKHAFTTGLQKPNKPWLGKSGSANPGSKAVEQLTNDGKLIAKFGSISEAGRLTGVAFQNISKVCNGQLKATGEYCWRFV